MRVISIPFLLVSAVSFAAGPRQAAMKEAPAPWIRMSRDGCFGTCPIYSLEIYRDGKVLFMGKKYTVKEGPQEGGIDQKALDQLKDAIGRSGFYSLREDCCNSYDKTDMPGVMIIVTLNKGVKRIEHYYGSNSAPTFLYDLENEIDRLSGAKKWISAEKD